MSDYNYHGPEDPFRRDDIYDPNARTGNTAWGWIAAAVFLVVVLAMLFGVGHQAGQPGTNTASNAKPSNNTDQNFQACVSRRLYSKAGSIGTR